MNNFVPLADYDYTFLGEAPEEWVDEYRADLSIEELEEEDMFDTLDIEV